MPTPTPSLPMKGYVSPLKGDDYPYRVIIGNIGTVCWTKHIESALEVYTDYCTRSSKGIGKAAGETVVILGTDGIVAEYDPNEPEA